VSLSGRVKKDSLSQRKEMGGFAHREVEKAGKAEDFINLTKPKSTTPKDEETTAAEKKT